MKTIVLFNNRGGVGKTTLLYHLAWMFSELGVRTVALDLDPQSNLTSLFISEDQLGELWEGAVTRQTIVAAVAPLLEEGVGDVRKPHLEVMGESLALVRGNLGLARMEDEMSFQWTKCLEGVAVAFRITGALHRAVMLAADEFKANLVLIDVAPSLGALNRCAVLAADHVVVPLVPDIYSPQELHNLGLTLHQWRSGWAKRLEVAPASVSHLPSGRMTPAGYIVLQPAFRQSQPVRTHLRWAERIPLEYRIAMGLPVGTPNLSLEDDPQCLAQLKHYRSLMPMAMEAGKPIFHLKPADGAIGAHVAAVAECAKDFHRLARRLALAVELDLPASARI